MFERFWLRLRLEIGLRPPDGCRRSPQNSPGLVLCAFSWLAVGRCFALRSLIHGFWGGRKSSICGVWAAPAPPTTIPERSPPPCGMVFGAAAPISGRPNHVLKTQVYIERSHFALHVLTVASRFPTRSLKHRSTTSGRSGAAITGPFFICLCSGGLGVHVAALWMAIKFKI